MIRDFKYHQKYCFFFIFLFTLISCSEEPKEEAPIENFFTSPSPISLGSIEADFYQNLSYNGHERNVFDIFLPVSESPTPLVIFIHGGGFVGGDKSFAYEGLLDEQIQDLLANNIAFATINYQLVEIIGEQSGIIKSMNDSKYCLQFIRHHSEFLNINPDQIVLEGASAGAGTSLWLAMHPDMKEPESVDEILRQSTRVSGSALWETQATYDLVKWDTHVFQDLNLNLLEQADTLIELKFAILGFYGIQNLDQLFDPSTVAYRERVDMLGLFSFDDPPIWVNNSIYSEGIPTTSNDLTHHPLHVKAILEMSEEFFIEATCYAPKIGIIDPDNEDVNQFIKRLLL